MNRLSDYFEQNPEQKIDITSDEFAKHMHQKLDEFLAKTKRMFKPRIGDRFNAGDPGRCIEVVDVTEGNIKVRFTCTCPDPSHNSVDDFTPENWPGVVLATIRSEMEFVPVEKGTAN